ncbi:hypothetical protein SAMN05446935_5139 [Burkholderia sp. YR290]|jgi:hypothetical protein|nr:hypothetical protein SAMN05446934_4061 [Paraburkholderia hospita]SOE84692.1 hypothetical protein SAMN05446935_5139 [Burkholderia sp. YR290]
MIRPVHETVVMFAFATRVRRVGVSKLCPQHAERRINPSKTVTIPVLTGARLLAKKINTLANLVKKSPGLLIRRDPSTSHLD